METTTILPYEYETGAPDVVAETKTVAVLPEAEEANPATADVSPRQSRRLFLVNAATAVLAFGGGLGVGFWSWGRPAAKSTVLAKPEALPVTTLTALPLPSGLPHRYTLPVTFGGLGPHLMRAGAFTYEAFAQVYAQAGQPLTATQQSILRQGSDEPMVIDHTNAYFLLNLLWAVGLVNNNPVLRTGALIANSGGQVDRLASTGGWSLAAKPIHELYSGSALVTLTATQQTRLEEAAALVYRPCCNNPTSFPDCNHGMAMLGLLELLAARDSTVAAMLETAKQVNSFWFPEQSQELALYYQAQTGQDFATINAREAVGAERFSSDGFAEVHNWLAANGKLGAPNRSGSSCGV